MRTVDICSLRIKIGLRFIDQLVALSEGYTNLKKEKISIIIQRVINDITY
jgi:hypothetical protein